MSLTETYENPKEYFQDALAFLAEYSWLHSFPNVEITTRNLLACYPPEWAEYFRNSSFSRITNIGRGIIDPQAPSSLKDFMQKVLNMTPKYELEEKNLELIRSKKFGLKKLHEVAYLAPLVHKHCQPKNIKYIVDIGAGCGYLSHVLFQTYGYKVLGIESSADIMKRARSVQRDHYIDSIGHVVFAQHKVTSDSGEDIMQLMYKSFKEYQGEDIFFVALHACADLSVYFMNLFRTSMECKGGIVMPCCYHLLNKSKFGFVSFPLSKACSEILEDGLIDTPFFRLATQQTSNRWGGLNYGKQVLQAKNLLYRNLLEEALDEVGLCCIRNFRKTGLTDDDDDSCSIQAYAAMISHNFDIVDDNTIVSYERTEVIKDRVVALYYEKGDNPELLMEAFISLQIFIQAFCENVILFDRVCYMHDFGQFNCITKKITNDVLSARCFAMILSRNENAPENDLKKPVVRRKAANGTLSHDENFEYCRTVRSVFK